MVHCTVCACVCVGGNQSQRHRKGRLERSMTAVHRERKQCRATEQEEWSVYCSAPKVKKQSKQKRQSGLGKEDGKL